MIDQRKLPDVVIRFMDAPYKLGGSHREEGYDCLSFFYYFYKALSVDLGQSFHGYTMLNYNERWEAGQGRKDFMDFLTSIGTHIEVLHMMPGDVLVFGADDVVFPGVYLGNNNVLTCFLKYGVVVIPMRNIEHRLMEVRRIG